MDRVEAINWVGIFLGLMVLSTALYVQHLRNDISVLSLEAYHDMNKTTEIQEIRSDLFVLQTFTLCMRLDAAWIMGAVAGFYSLFLHGTTIYNIRKGRLTLRERIRRLEKKLGIGGLDG